MCSSRFKLNSLFLNTSVVVCLFPGALICYSKRAVTTKFMNIVKFELFYEFLESVKS